MSTSVAEQQDYSQPTGDAQRDPLSIPSEVKASISILVVDDDRTLREGCASVLQIDGYNVSFSGRGDEAIEMVRRRKYDTPRGFGRDGGGGDDHMKGMAHKLTARFADDEDALALGPSVDHVIAAEVNPGEQGARRPPLNLLVGRGGGSRGLGYSSYSASMQPVAGINNPWNAYSDFMNLNGGGTGDGEAEMRILQRRQSVLDLVRTDFEALSRAPLSNDDKQKLDAHFTAIRTLETTMGDSGLACMDMALRDRASMYEGASRSAMAMMSIWRSAMTG